MVQQDHGIAAAGDGDENRALDGLHRP
jgi:hypothetical protein